ncbi:MAG: SDR family NAD(P)-dependent oxidoreductase [Armatimonadetes bacterium]|nr:SDR family NAD(P)-dependent oxidoreductase [Armatimonadota bacterium]MDW8028955.1 SDR family NAD(P)-dependent oxidoreductase [Armatimonadota bacterium]
MELKGKVALVTGSAKRLGKAIALALGKYGCNIAVHYRLSESEALETVKQLRSMRVKSAHFCADLTNEEQVKAMFESVAQTFGGLDILVNNAAIFARTPFDQLDVNTWQKFIDTNLTSVFLCSRYASDFLSEGQGGVIINISDTAAFKPWAGFLPYCVSKAGVIALTLGLAKALAPKVRVNCVALGTILPPEDYGEDWEREMSAKTLMQRLGTTEEVVQAVIFCITCDYLTGAVIPLDGGRHLR